MSVTFAVFFGDFSDFRQLRCSEVSAYDAHAQREVILLLLAHPAAFFKSCVICCHILCLRLNSFDCLFKIFFKIFDVFYSDAYADCAFKNACIFFLFFCTVRIDGTIRMNY